MITTLLISMLGWLSVGRIFTKFHDRKFLSAHRCRQIQFLTLLLFIFPTLLSWSNFAAWIYCLAINVATLFVPKIRQIQIRNEFQKNMIPAVDAILLSLGSGTSFRESLQRLNNNKTNYGFYIHEIISLILLRQPFILKSEAKNKDKILVRFYLELNSAAQTTHRVADRIKSFRYLLKTEETFRQKSSMATLQARAQSIIVGILYFLALTFNFYNFSENLDFKMMCLSVFLFVLGLFWVWKLGGHHQWKV